MSTLDDLSGRRFGRWTVLRRAQGYRSGGIRWACQCACGAAKDVAATSLAKGVSKSCGCLNREKLVARTINLAGRRCGRLIVLRRVENGANDTPRWACRCDCGREVVKSGASLRDGDEQSCGCWTPALRAAAQLIDIAGERFGRLVAIERVGSMPRSHDAAWRCTCDCGRETVTSSASLRNGRTKSCGCLARELTGKRAWRHGFAQTPTQKTYYSMIRRCSNPASKNWPDYGGRGIRVCERWFYGEDGKTGFQCFLEDMGPCPEGMSIDRINNDGGYGKANCRWADDKTQQRNTRRNHRVTHNGVEKCLSEWSEETGIASTVLRARLKGGWSAERAITTPVDPTAGRFRACSHG